MLLVGADGREQPLPSVGLEGAWAATIMAGRALASVRGCGGVSGLGGGRVVPDESCEYITG